MNGHDDRELRELYVALSDDDAASAPEFSDLIRRRMSSPPARRPRFAWAAVLGGAAVAATLLLVVLLRAGDRSTETAIAQAESMSSWSAPTDSWLTLSGLEIPSSVPSLSLSSVTLPEASAPATTSGETR